MQVLFCILQEIKAEMLISVPTVYCTHILIRTIQKPKH